MCFCIYLSQWQNAWSNIRGKDFFWLLIPVCHWEEGGAAGGAQYIPISRNVSGHSHQSEWSGSRAPAGASRYNLQRPALTDLLPPAKFHLLTYILQSSAIGWRPRAGWETFQIQAIMRLNSQGGASSSILTTSSFPPCRLSSRALKSSLLHDLAHVHVIIHVPPFLELLFLQNEWDMNIFKNYVQEARRWCAWKCNNLHRRLQGHLPRSL